MRETRTIRHYAISAEEFINILKQNFNVVGELNTIEKFNSDSYGSNDVFITTIEESEPNTVISYEIQKMP